MNENTTPNTWKKVHIWSFEHRPPSIEGYEYDFDGYRIEDVEDKLILFNDDEQYIVLSHWDIIYIYHDDLGNEYIDEYDLVSFIDYLGEAKGE